MLRVRGWFSSLIDSNAKSISDLTTLENTSRARISTQLPLAFLARHIKETIHDGRQ
jgi:hypothetical protein